jgi:hypothetical protein
MADFNSWKSSVLGVGIDVDHAYGNQCVDVILSWAQACFPGVSWPTLFPPVGSAKQLFNDANANYFVKIANDVNDANQVPQAGDIMVFDATPKSGYTNQYYNPDGHTGVCDGANGSGYNLIQQDGSNPSGKTFESFTAWKYRPTIGWLRPKTGAVGPTPAPAGGKTLFLPASVQKWRVYNVRGPWTVGNEIAFLWPSKFPPGLSYEIQATLAPNIYQIQTQDFGIVAIYAGPDTDAQIR